MLVWDFQLLNTKNLRLGADARGAIGTIIQEVTPEGDVVMEWRSWDHLPLAFWETNMLIVNEMWDLFHSNSLGEAENGSILLSMRRMNQVAKIHRCKKLGRPDNHSCISVCTTEIPERSCGVSEGRVATSGSSTTIEASSWGNMT
mmetsp:Transcript_13475/g.38867  ORF Transcript_13475/g.38867 Transcript_13475/m.38867 type:complete len:145 (+) Transcript_13475:231-665(+)